MKLAFDLLVQGLIAGALYALVAVGLTMVFGLLRILHVAHAGLFALGAYLGLVVTNATGSLLVGLLVAVLVAGVLGMAIYRLCYQPILAQPPYVALIASIGLFIAMEEIYRIAFGAYGLSYRRPPLPGTVALFGMTIKHAEIAVMIAAVVLLSGLHLFASRTRAGMAWRATVTDPAMAASCGVDIVRVRYTNFFLGSALAAAAGVMVGILNNLVEPTMGEVPSYKALAIIVLGGLGDVKGTLIAALLLGVVESFGSIYLSAVLDKNAIAFAALLGVLLVRPQGLFGK
jgi:branched-chain amino acid transport system permease protein